MKCSGAEHIGNCKGEVELRSRMTAYHWSEESKKAGDPDPNAPIAMCESCYEEYSAGMQEMWNEYYGIVAEGIAGGLARMEDRDFDDDYSNSYHFYEDDY